MYTILWWNAGIFTLCKDDIYIYILTINHEVLPVILWVSHCQGKPGAALPCGTSQRCDVLTKAMSFLELFRMNEGILYVCIIILLIVICI